MIDFEEKPSIAVEILPEDFNITAIPAAPTPARK